MESYYNWVHETGMHMYTIPTIICLVLLIIVFARQITKRKKADEQLEKELYGESEDDE